MLALIAATIPEGMAIAIPENIVQGCIQESHEGNQASRSKNWSQGLSSIHVLPYVVAMSNSSRLRRIAKSLLKLAAGLDSNARVAAAIKNSGEEYIKKTLNMRNGNGLGSQFIHPQTIEDLLKADWQPLTEGAEHVKPGCHAFMAHIPGVLGAAPISMFPDSMKAVLRPSMHRPDLAELLAVMPHGLPKVKFTTIILGEVGGKGEVVFTFHPGAPTSMGDPITVESVQHKFKTDSDTIPVTIGVAKKLGFLNVKAR